MIPFGIFIFGFLFICLAIFLSEIDSYIGSVIAMVSALIFGYVFYDLQYLHIIRTYPVELVGGVIVYLTLGSAYTLLWKWPVWLDSNEEKIIRSYETFKNLYGDVDQDENTWFEEFKKTSYYDAYSPQNNKSMLFNYVFLWLFNFLWTIIKNPVVWVWNLIYDAISGILVRTQDNKMKKFTR